MPLPSIDRTMPATFPSDARRAVWATLAAMALLHPAQLAWSAPLEPGARLPEIVLKDQHDRPVAVTASTRRLVFSAERAVGDMVSKLLSAQPAGVLDRQHAVYVADISAMPSLVTRMFALPKMRELPFAMGLVREAAEQAQVADLPRQPGAATVLHLADGRVRQIDLVRNEAQLLAALGLAP